MVSKLVKKGNFLPVEASLEKDIESFGSSGVFAAQSLLLLRCHTEGTCQRTRRTTAMRSGSEVDENRGSIRRPGSRLHRLVSSEHP